ncbi:MAG: hypothetical protein ACYC77_01740 [Coriobacteriia bacterium]
MVTSGVSSGFDQFVYYAGPIVQLLYWVVMASVSVWAVLLLKRYVDHKTRDRAATKPPAPATNISIDEFVE